MANKTVNEVNYFDEDGRQAFKEFLTTSPPYNLLPLKECYTPEEEKEISHEYYKSLQDYFIRIHCPDYGVDDIVNYDLYTTIEALYDLCDELIEANNTETIKNLSLKIHKRLIEAYVLESFTYYDVYENDEIDEYY